MEIVEGWSVQSRFVFIEYGSLKISMHATYFGHSQYDMYSTAFAKKGGDRHTLNIRRSEMCQSENLTEYNLYRRK